jgi:hypothetical protein
MNSVGSIGTLDAVLPAKTTKANPSKGGDVKLPV